MCLGRDIGKAELDELRKTKVFFDSPPTLSQDRIDRYIVARA